MVDGTNFLSWNNDKTSISQPPHCEPPQLKPVLCKTPTTSILQTSVEIWHTSQVFEPRRSLSVREPMLDKSLNSSSDEEMAAKQSKVNEKFRTKVDNHNEEETDEGTGL